MSPELVGLRLLESLRLLKVTPPRPPSAPAPRFSAEEWDHLRLVGKNYTDKEIAEELRVAERTAKRYVRRLKFVAGVRTREELRRLYHQSGEE